MGKKKGLDVIDDFDKPTKTQAALLPDQEPVVPEMVQNGRFMATFLGPKKFSYDKDGNKQITLEFSVQPLVPAFSKVLPEKVITTWQYLVSTDNPRSDVDLDPQTILVFIDPKEKNARVQLTAAQITGCTVSRVTSKGKGKTTVGMRLKFSALYAQNNELALFACNNHGQLFWIDMAITQAHLPVVSGTA